MFHLLKLINSIDNDDTLTMYIENNDYQDGVTLFRIKNLKWRY